MKRKVEVKQIRGLGRVRLGVFPWGEARARNKRSSFTGSGRLRRERYDPRRGALVVPN
jgi:hypothetical protein